MGKRPEKTVAIYEKDDLELYQSVVAHLEDRGMVAEDTAEGKKLATICRYYMNREMDSGTTETASRLSLPSLPSDMILGVLGYFVVLALIVAGVLYYVFIYAG